MKKPMETKRQLEIITEIEKTILENCDNPLDYDGYIENCLLFDSQAIADFYGQTVAQIKYLVTRARLRL